MISGVVITYNEEANIKACLLSLLELCDDIVVVDAHSQDNTTKIATALGAYVYEKPWEGYGNARNFGAEKARHDWIVSIDADESLSPSLISSFKDLKLESQHIYQCNRLTQYCQKWIYHGAWHPEWKSRLYHKRYNSWDLQTVHEQLISPPGTKKIRIKGLLLHYAYQSHDELLLRLDKYALLIAKQWKKDGYSPSPLKRILSPIYHFFRYYIIKRGFLDGRDGLKIAKAMKDYHRQKFICFLNLT